MARRLTIRSSLVLLALQFINYTYVQAQYYTDRTDYINANAHFITNRNSWIWVGIANVNINPPEFQGVLGDFENVKGSAVSDPITGELLFYVNNKKGYSTNNAPLPGGEYLLPYTPNFDVHEYCGFATDNNPYAPAEEHFRITGNPSQGVAVIPFQDSTGNPFTNKFISFNMPGAGHSYDNPVLNALYGLAWDWPVDNWGKGLPAVYSIIDMELYGGLGGVAPENLRKPLVEDNYFGEGMITIPGNDCDIWLINHHIDSAIYYAWRVNGEGVATEPVVSALGSVIHPGKRTYQKNKWAVSPTREKVAMVSQYDSAQLIPIDLSVLFGFPPGTFVGEGVDRVSYDRLSLVDFDVNTGLFSNEMRTEAGFFYDVEFSAEGNYLYATGHDWEWADIMADGSYYNFLVLDTPYYYKLYQFNMATTNAFVAYQQKNFPPPKIDYYWIKRDNFTRMHKLPSGSLLFNTEEANNLDVDRLNYNFITLNNTNTPLDDNAFTLDQFLPYFESDNTCMSFGYTTIINAMSNGQSPVVYPLHGEFRSEQQVLSVCYGDTIRPLYAAFDNQYSWDDGSAADYKVVTEPGTYWVSYRPNYCITQTDTFIIEEVTDLRFDLGADTLLCDGAGFELEPLPVPNPYSYLWQDGNTGASYLVTQTDSYAVTIEYQGCRHEDSIYIEQIDLSFDLGQDQQLCYGDPIQLVLSASFDDVRAGFLWNDFSTDSSLLVTDTGHYSLTVSIDPCSFTDSVVILYEQCECKFGMPNAFSPNGDGLNDRFTPVLAPDCPIEQYRLHVFNRYGQRVFVSYNPDDGWDGSFNGQQQDLGMYFYEMSYIGGTKRNTYYQKGDLTLIR